MKLIYWETLQNKRLEGETSLNKVIARFQEFFNQILCNSNGLLAPPDIDFIQYHQSLIVDIDHSYPEIYYDFEHSDRAGYSLFFTERNTHRLLYRCQDETIAAYALLSVYINRCVPSLKRTAEARHRVQEEIKLGNIENAQKIVLETVGNDSVSFNKKEYSKISLLPIDDKKMDVFFHNHTICPNSYFNKPNIQQGYHILMVYGYYLWVFRELSSRIQTETALNKFEYLYLTGHNENNLI